MNIQTAKQLVLAALVLSCTNTVQAAVTFTQGNVTSATDILHTGTVIEANNLGGIRQAVTINGISFGTSEASVAGMGDSGGDFSNQFAGNAAMDNLFSSLAFQFGNSSSLSLSGLSVGSSYFLQLFMQNNINSTGTTSAVSLQNQTYNLSNFGSAAEYLRISFVANATTQLVTFGKNSSNEPDRMILNAYVLQSDSAPVPVPATLPLLGIAGAALMRRQRKAWLSNLQS